MGSSGILRYSQIDVSTLLMYPAEQGSRSARSHIVRDTCFILRGIVNMTSTNAFILDFGVC
jgi:hypothetical protein